MSVSSQSLPKLPLDRLNYYNGQRLEAEDFRLEQEYHIRVRRWLNKSLYSWGIAAGLEVTVKEGDAHKVIVHPGMALDAEGREIILLEAREMQVMGTPSTAAGLVFGNYLVIQYTEEKVAPQEDGCCVPTKDKKGQKIAWGGPSRIACKPHIQWLNNWPTEASGKIVLAQVELDDACAVRDIRTAVRKYVGPVKADFVRALAIEGEKDIDSENTKELYFHIEGGLPNSVMLYLRGSKFSTLYYTEMGSHNHVIDVALDSFSTDLSHFHKISEGQTGPGTKHRHAIWVDDGQEAPGVDVDTGDGWNSTIISEEDSHTHPFEGLTTDSRLSTLTVDQSASGTAALRGAPDQTVRSGSSYKYVNDLQVVFDDQDITQALLAQLRDRDGQNMWATLGNGQASHDLIITGTGAIDLMRLGVDLSPGEHHITLKVPDGGGKIHYNLYVS
jgi:hypothetical protein